MSKSPRKPNHTPGPCPELLRELKACLCFIESFKDYEETLTAAEVFDNFAAGGNWAQVQAIVAKAEGREVSHD